LRAASVFSNEEFKPFDSRDQHRSLEELAGELLTVRDEPVTATRRSLEERRVAAGLLM